MALKWATVESKKWKKKPLDARLLLLQWQQSSGERFLCSRCVISHIQATPVAIAVRPSLPNKPKDKKMHGRRERGGETHEVREPINENRSGTNFKSDAEETLPALSIYSSHPDRRRPAQLYPAEYLRRPQSELADQNSATTDGTNSNVVAGPNGR
jgi:hypothetical protein